MKLLYKLLLLVLPITFIACTDDEGNYDYTALNDLTISGVENMTVEQFSNLQITPEIKATTNFDENNYDYLWYIYMVNGIEDPDTLSREKNLNAEITVAPGEYDLMFIVTDKNTGIFYSQRSEVIVVNSYSKGVAVLSQEGINANLAFINIANQVSQNVYQEVNGEVAGTYPKGVFYTTSDELPKMLYISTEEGTKVIDPTSFNETIDFEELLYFPDDKNSIEAHCKSGWGYNEYLIINGKIRHRYLSFTDDMMYETAVKGNYRMAPFSLYEDNDAFFYDELSQSFVCYSYGFYTANAGGNTTLFDPADMQATMLWGTCIETTENSVIRAVMKGNDGTIYAIAATKNVGYDPDTWDTIAELIPTNKISLDRPDTQDAVSYTVSSTDPSFLYCACGNKIVCISLTTGNIISTYTFDEAQVDYIEFNRDESADIMYVGVSDGSGSQNSGSVYYLKKNSNGTLEKANEFKNICGKVVDFQFKY